MDFNTTIIFDPQYITQVGISAILKSQINLPISVTNSKKELIELLSESPKSLAILDFSLSDLSSTDDLQNIIARFSESRWIIFSEDFNVTFIKRILHSSAVICFLLKSSSSEEINSCFTSIVKEQTYLSPLLQSMLEEEQDTAKEKLTLTETEVLKEIANGLSAKQVASKRNTSVHTVITHKKNIYRKLQINTIQEAYIYAMRAGILNINDYAI